MTKAADLYSVQPQQGHDSERRPHTDCSVQSRVTSVFRSYRECRVVVALALIAAGGCAPPSRDNNYATARVPAVTTDGREYPVDVRCAAADPVRYSTSVEGVSITGSVGGTPVDAKLGGFKLTPQLQGKINAAYYTLDSLRFEICKNGLLNPRDPTLADQRRLLYAAVAALNAGLSQSETPEAAAAVADKALQQAKRLSVLPASSVAPQPPNERAQTVTNAAVTTPITAPAASTLGTPKPEVATVKRFEFQKVAMRPGRYETLGLAPLVVGSVVELCIPVRTNVVAQGVSVVAFLVPAGIVVSNPEQVGDAFREQIDRCDALGDEGKIWGRTIPNAGRYNVMLTLRIDNGVIGVFDTLSATIRTPTTFNIGLRTRGTI